MITVMTCIYLRLAFICTLFVCFVIWGELFQFYFSVGLSFMVSFGGFGAFLGRMRGFLFFFNSVSFRFRRLGKNRDLWYRPGYIRVFFYSLHGCGGFRHTAWQWGILGVPTHGNRRTCIIGHTPADWKLTPQDGRLYIRML